MPLSANTLAVIDELGRLTTGTDAAPLWECVERARIAGDHRDAGVVEAPRSLPVFYDELDFEAWKQDFVEDPDEQLVLTDGEAPHQATNL